MKSFHTVSRICFWMLLVTLLSVSNLVPYTLAFTIHRSTTSSIIQKSRYGPTNLFSTSTPPPPPSPSSSPAYFELSVDMPPAGSGLVAKLRFKPILSVPSEIIVVRYTIPFGLDVVPKDGMAICTKDGKGGEKVGDVLRYTSQWTLGLPQGDGVVSTAVAFSGGVRWQCTLFDVMKARVWQQVVEALVSNTPQRTNEVVLVFERPKSLST